MRSGSTVRTRPCNWGNWLISANTLDRWWGPAHESSLILSNNARPMPTVMVERAEARAPGVSWLSWLGPYRFSFGISQMEDDREDVDSPLFMAWRVVFMPFKKIELGFSRTAQFCGEGLPCDLETFGNMLAGNDNVGFDATEEDEPGNQMAGFDHSLEFAHRQSAVRDLRAIHRRRRVVLYTRKVPQATRVLKSGSPWRTAGWCRCSSNMPPPPAPPTPTAVLITTVPTTRAGSTSRDIATRAGSSGTPPTAMRRIGRSATSYAAADGTLWTAAARKSRLNRDDFGDTRNTVASVPTDYGALELGWKGRLFGEQLSVETRRRNHRARRRGA